jgi:hypothetical protein
MVHTVVTTHVQVGRFFNKKFSGPSAAEDSERAIVTNVTLRVTVAATVHLQ